MLYDIAALVANKVSYIVAYPAAVSESIYLSKYILLNVSTVDMMISILTVMQVKSVHCRFAIMNRSNPSLKQCFNEWDRCSLAETPTRPLVAIAMKIQSLAADLNRPILLRQNYIL